MMDSQILQQVVADQRELIKRKKLGIPRQTDVEKHLRSKQISVISGIRRSGKSTFMLQIADRLQDFHFITFDDERFLNFTISDFNALMIELEKSWHSKNLFFDEIQNIPGWERFARRLYDQDYKVYISGSNSKLLNSELATHLTGRYIKTELFPFSFPEYLTLKKINHDARSTYELSQVIGAFDTYLVNGGFPEYLTTSDQGYLGRIYEDIIYRDIIARFGIRNSRGFRNLAQYLFTNFTKETNYNALAKILGFNSTTSIREYISCLSESYLLFEMYRYDNSLKRQYLSNKKIYVTDNGLRNAVSFRTGQDTGRMLENLVFIELRRRGRECWFYRTAGGLEVDFYIPGNDPQLIQVCYNMTDLFTRKRETSSLENAMAELNMKESLILSYNERSEIKTGSGLIRIVPTWQWLLGA